VAATNGSTSLGRKKTIFALLPVSNSYLFETGARYPYTAGQFELIEVRYRFAANEHKRHLFVF